MTLPFFTIGHSTRSLAEFAGMLTAAGVKHLVDVRTVPRSRTNPQFDRSVLPDSLAAYGVSYTHAADLGGLRGKSKETPPEVNGLWSNDSFHHYADYALTPAFHEGFAKLVEIGHQQATAVMCAEAVWWRCHRRIIADYLLARGEEVFHLMGEGKTEAAKLTVGAVIRPDKSVVYPAPDRQADSA